MRAIVLAALVCATIGHSHAFFGYGYDTYHDVRTNYHEMMTNCEREGGECISVDFGGPDPDPVTLEPTLPPTEAPPIRLVPVYVPFYQTTRAPRRVVTRAPSPVYRVPPPRTAIPPLFQNVPTRIFKAAPPPTLVPPKPVTLAPIPSTRASRPKTKAPRPTTKAPRPTTKTPRPTTKAPRPTTKAPRPTKKAPIAKKKMPRAKNSKIPPKGKGRRAWLRRNPEYEGVERRKRALWGPGPYDYLYNECTGGWEFDLGCGARGMNVCCYPSNTNGY